VNLATTGNMEAQLQAVWEEKLERLSGGGTSREENLVLFSQVRVSQSTNSCSLTCCQVWDAVWPRLQPKESLDYLSTKNGHCLPCSHYTTIELANF
jgi:hypothetical protein